MHKKSRYRSFGSGFLLLPRWGVVRNRNWISLHYTPVRADPTFLRQPVGFPSIRHIADSLRHAGDGKYIPECAFVKLQAQNAELHEKLSCLSVAISAMLAVTRPHVTG